MMAMQAEARPYNYLMACGKRVQKEFERIFRRQSLTPILVQPPPTPNPGGVKVGTSQKKTSKPVSCSGEKNTFPFQNDKKANRIR